MKVNEENIVFAEKFVDNLSEYIFYTPCIYGLPQFKKLLLDLVNLEHSVSVCILASILSRKLGFDSFQTIRIIGLSAFLHDIGKYEICSDFIELLTEEMTPAQLSYYKKHPLKGAEILGQLGKEIHPTVIQAVLQHHERHDATGFPENLHGDKINLVSQIIGICDEFLRQVEKAKKLLAPNPLPTFKMLNQGKFSVKTMQAFYEVFLDIRNKKNESSF